MSKRRESFIDALKDVVGERTPSEEQIRVTDIAQNFYMNLRGGKVCKHVTTTMVMYIRSVLPELSLEQASELNHSVHTLIMTVLSYLVEDDLIKEE